MDVCSGMAPPQALRASSSYKGERVLRSRLVVALALAHENGQAWRKRVRSWPMRGFHSGRLSRQVRHKRNFPLPSRE